MIEGLDLCLAWLLWLPRDLSLGLMAISSAVLATILRKWATNQDQLRRCSRDIVRLRELIRETKEAGGNSQEIGRLKSLLARIKRVQLRADILVMAWSIGPLALGAYWASVRMNHLPTRLGDEVELQAYFPLSSMARLAHVVPHSNFELRSSAIQEVASDDVDPTRASARWVVVPRIQQGAVELTLVCSGQRVQHPLLVDQARSAIPSLIHDGKSIMQTDFRLRQYQFLGMVPGIARVGLDPWLAAYLLLAIPLLPLFRRLASVV